MRMVSLCRLVLLVLVAGAAPAAAQEAAVHLVKTGAFAEDLYLAGGGRRARDQREQDNMAERNGAHRDRPTVAQVPALTSPARPTTLGESSRSLQAKGARPHP